MSDSIIKTGADLRRAFLDFFIRNGHTEVPSSPLVPHGDPTLMFTTAGMVQFKPYYSATGDVPYTRATSVQKCLRLTDLDNVGLTPRHDTFFEMLGNFSFGPKSKGAYFKEEATALAWEFVTKTLGLPRERLFISIFGGESGVPRDDEAAALWVKLGLDPSHLVALGRKDNFWGPAGGAGACGPCSEIYFDLGEKRPDYLPDGAFWGETAIPAVTGRGFLLFAIEQDGRIVGCAFAGPSKSRPGVWSLRHLAVDPTTRHAGHGAALVAEGARRARSAGAEVLAIGIVAENSQLSQWYRRLGFESIDKTQYPGLVFTVERMRLLLEPI